MAITFGTAVTATPTFSWDGSQFTASVSYTLASGSTQIAVEIHGATIGTLTILWNGSTLTERASVSDANTGLTRYHDLDAPTSGTFNVVVNSTHDISGAGITIFGISGVATGTPRRPVATGNANSGTASVAATTVAGDVVVGVVSTVNSASIDGSMTALQSNLLASGEYGSSGYITATGTSTTVQWTATSGFWAIAAIPYIPAAAGGSGIVPFNQRQGGGFVDMAGNLRG